MKRIVFLSLSPEMWDGIETLWDKAVSDPENEVTVIPLPTYKRDLNGNLYDARYSLSGYPDNIQVTDVNAYSLKKNHPDIIYTQSIQDADNSSFCVHPAFHSNALKNYTDQLVYVPYMCTEQISFDNKPYLDHIRFLFIYPAIFNNVDHIIVQSQNQKSLYLHYLAGENPELTKYWSQRISYEDYPRNEILKKYTRNSVYHPQTWDSFLCSNLSAHKKTVLLCTSVMGILIHEHRAINMLKDLFEEQLKNMDKQILIWRPYPAIKAAIEMLRPKLLNDYNNLISFYLNNHVGILDELPTPTPAIIMSDEYTGDSCGIMELFKTTGKPITQLDYDIKSH